MKVLETSSAPDCPICHTGSKFEAGFSDVHLYRCPVCDHCFTDLARIRTLEQYGPEYFATDHKNWFDNPNLNLFRRIRETIAKEKQDASVLDVGCGNGDFLKYLRRVEPGLALTGIDLAPCRPVEGIQFIQGNVETYAFPQHFDAVVSLAVIEHMPDVRRFSHSLVELCKTGGLVVTTTLNDRSVLYEAARLLNRIEYTGPFERLYSKHHLNHFNTRSLRRLFDTSGLSTVGLLRHDIPMAAVDFEASSVVLQKLLRIGVWGTFLLGRISGRTYLQTLFCRKL